MVEEVSFSAEGKILTIENSIVGATVRHRVTGRVGKIVSVEQYAPAIPTKNQTAISKPRIKVRWMDGDESPSHLSIQDFVLA